MPSARPSRKGLAKASKGRRSRRCRSASPGGALRAACAGRRLRPAAAGCGLGAPLTAGALGIARIIATFFPGMRIDSVAIFLGTTLLLVAIALLACWLPARRAGRIDATLALRAD